MYGKDMRFDASYGGILARTLAGILLYISLHQ